MSKLRDTLEKYILTQHIEQEYQQYVLEKMEEEIVQEIVKQKVQEINDKAKAEREQEEVSQRIDSARNAFWTVVVLGLLLGLLGNQITELISDTKGTSVAVTWILVLVMILSVYAIYEIAYLSQAKAIINKWLKKRQEDNE
ncbi:MAG: hypothetical protein MR947_01025 [Mitsuokella jalaludinii]|nr:hypothetical protein [Mitsuokella jalaludinii]